MIAGFRKLLAVYDQKHVFGLQFALNTFHDARDAVNCEASEARRAIYVVTRKHQAPRFAENMPGMKMQKKAKEKRRREEARRAAICCVVCLVRRPHPFIPQLLVIS
jgi:hypothetical protein